MTNHTISAGAELLAPLKSAGLIIRQIVRAADDCLDLLKRNNLLVVQAAMRQEIGGVVFQVVQSRGVTELMCAFEEERDADDAARTMDAAATAPYPGWHTQRSFLLDGQKQDELSALAGKYRHRRRRA